MTTTIDRISAAPYNLRLKTPLRWGAGHEMPALTHILVRVELSDGAVGIAEINPRPTIYGETPESVEAIIRAQIAPQIIGQALESVDDIGYILQQFRLIKHNNSARAGIDMALWDALAQSKGLNLSELLGVSQDKVRVSYILGTGELHTLLAEVDAVYGAGVRVLKIKVGKNFDVERNLIRQIKQAYPDMDFYIDANETLTANNAIEQLAAFTQLGALYCEEPLPVQQLRQRASLHQQHILPLIADDSAFTLRDLERELDFDTFDILNIKPPRNGFSESRAMMQQVHAHDKTVMLGSQASSILGCIYTLLLAATDARVHPSEGTFWLKVEDEVGLHLEDGYATVSELERVLQNELPHYLPYENAYRLLGTTNGLTDTQEIALRLDVLPESTRNRIGRKNAVAQLRAFTGVLLPELNHILVQVEQSAESLRDELPEADRLRLIDGIRVKTKKSLKLALDLRDAAYVDLQLPVQHRRTHFDRLVRMVFETYQRDRFHRRDIQAMLHLDDEQDYILLGQDWMLLTAIGHLLDNACQHTADGGRIDVTLRIDEDDDISFAVRDNGTGIPLEHHPYVYDKWFHDKTKGGYGLGLYITRYIIQAHGGHIWFESDRHGTVFFVTLPRQPEDDNKNPPDEQADLA